MHPSVYGRFVKLQQEMEEITHHDHGGPVNWDSEHQQKQGGGCVTHSGSQPEAQHKDKQPVDDNQLQNSGPRASFLNKYSLNLQKWSKDQVLTMVPDTMKTKQEPVCLIHQKVLDIICLKDQSLICANCAIFGHKGHFFKSLKQFEQQKLSYCKGIVQTLCQRQQLKDKLTSLETKSLVRERLKKKKEELMQDIRKQFQNWFKQLEQAQNFSIEKVNKHLAELEKTTFQKLKIPVQLQSQYQQWHRYADREMEVFQNHSVDEQIKTLNYLKKSKPYDVQVNGASILQKFQAIYDTGMNLLGKEIVNLKASYDNRLTTQIKNIPDIITQNEQNDLSEIIAETIKSGTRSRHPKQDIEIPTQDLLIEPELKIPLLKQIDQNRGSTPRNSLHVSSEITRNRMISLPNEGNLTCSSVLSSKFQSPTKSASKGRGLYHFSSKSSIKSPRGTLSGIKTSLNRTPKTLSEQKYDHFIDDMIKSHSNILNLDNAQLGDNKLINILQRLRCVKVRTAILSRNKLTDAFIEKMWSLMPHVETVNLSNNNLTDKILNNMLTTRRLQKNKNLILYNNRIKEKEVKFKIEALHRLGVHIEL